MSSQKRVLLLLDDDDETFLLPQKKIVSVCNDPLDILHLKRSTRDVDNISEGVPPLQKRRRSISFSEEDKTREQISDSSTPKKMMEMEISPRDAPTTPTTSMDECNSSPGACPPPLAELFQVTGGDGIAKITSLGFGSNKVRVLFSNHHTNRIKETTPKHQKMFQSEVVKSSSSPLEGGRSSSSGSGTTIVSRQSTSSPASPIAPTTITALPQSTPTATLHHQSTPTTTLPQSTPTATLPHQSMPTTTLPQSTPTKALTTLTGNGQINLSRNGSSTSSKQTAGKTAQRSKSVVVDKNQPTISAMFSKFRSPPIVTSPS